MSGGIFSPRAALLVAIVACAGLLAMTALDARAATPEQLAARATAMADAISVDWSRAVGPSGSIVDPLGRAGEGEYGQAMLAYGMLRAGARDPTLALGPLASRALLDSVRLESSPFAILGMAEALLAGGQLASSTATALEKALGVHPSYGSRAVGTPCYRRIGCYSNLKLVYATATLAALHAISPLRARVPVGGRPTSPARAAAEARRLIGSTVPRVEIPDGELRVGGATFTDGAVLSDPTRNPTAYLALSTAMLGRARSSWAAPHPRRPCRPSIAQSSRCSA
jgi:hypothetical protein